MSSKFKRNTIISGHIDSFCLVCERHFDSEEAANNHIADEEHEQRLLQHPYLDKYQGNHIRKVNKGYFCEFCSVILIGTARVNLHVAQKSHFTNKGYFLLKRVGSVIIAFDDILIKEKAWHSFADEACAICGTEFENERLHKMESGHLLKMVMTKVEFAANSGIYRKIDDGFFQCVTCNTVCALESLGEHFAGADHKTLYAQCQKEMKMYREQNKLTDTSFTNEKPNVKKLEELKETKPEIETASINKVPSKVDENQNNTETATVAIPKPNESQAIEPKKSDDTESNDEATTYANENNLTYNPGNSNAYCRLCETKVPSHLRAMREHVAGKEHKLKMTKAAQEAAEKLKPTRRPMHKYVEYCVNVENFFCRDSVINGKICVATISWLMITEIEDRYRCQSCELNLYDDDDIKSHKKSDKHLRAMKETPVITSLNSEFVREVRPNIYHCGFCNLVIGSWSSVDAHLQSREHAGRRGEWQWRLQRNLPLVQEHRRREEQQMFKLYMMLQHGIDLM